MTIRTMVAAAWILAVPIFAAGQSPQSAPSGWVEMSTVVQDKTNVRSAGDITAPVLTQLMPGQRVLVKRTEGDWWLVRTPDTSADLGWVRRDRLDEASLGSRQAAHVSAPQTPTPAGGQSSQVLNEYGDTLIAFNPTRPPIRTDAETKSRVWNCDGVVDPIIQRRTHLEALTLAQSNGFPLPRLALCEYHITKVLNPSNKAEFSMRSVRLYYSEDEMKDCHSGRPCRNMYMMTIGIHKDRMIRSYVFSGPTAKAHGACVKDDGTFASNTRNCMSLLQSAERIY